MTDAHSGSRADRVERFRVLYDAAYPRVVSYVTRRARSTVEADDLVADVFATAWRRLDDVPPGERAMPWFYGVARRTLANHYRSDDRKRRLRDRIEAEPAAGVDAFDAVHEALDRLRPDDREILTLHAWDDLESPEIAMVLGIPATTAAVRLHRARKRFARDWERAGVRNPRMVKSNGVSATPQEVKGTTLGEVTRE